MGSNYPPGTGPSDPNAPWNAPDMAHDHEWEPHDEMHPIFEDGAAIFVEQCRWEKVLDTEPGYEGRVVTESIPCEEQRTVRFEPVEVRHGNDDYTLTVKRDQFEDDNGDLIPPVEQALHDIEGHSAKSEEVEILDLDPDWQHGHVVAEINGFRLRYTPGTQTNRSAD